MLNPTITYVLCVVFVATLFRSAFGFGEALVAVPLLALRIPVMVAAPLAVLLSIMIAGIVVAQDWRDIHRKSAFWLVISTLAGIPLGLIILKTANDRLIKILLASILLAFSLYSLFNQHRFHLRRDRLSWLLGFGFCAGVLGGAYGMNGPPLAIYGSLRRWPAREFRATLQGYFLPASLVGLLGYWIAGFLSSVVIRYFVLSLLPVFVAVLIGRQINRKLHGRSFLGCVYLVLIVIGLTLLIETLSGRLI